MKQSAVKTLGVAALGAAFAAAGAGAANAAPVPDASQALDTVTQTLPVQNVDGVLPGAGEALAQAQPAVAAGLSAVQPAAEQALADGPTAQLSSLLGGLPVGQAGLPVSGLPVSGLPLG